MATTTINVSNATQLAAALKISTGGETIKLAAGNYGKLALYKFLPDRNVTIESATATKAIFTNVNFNQVSNVTLSKLEITTTPAVGEPLTNLLMTVMSSSHLNFNYLDVHGSLNHLPNDDKSGMRITASNDIVVLGTSFHDLNLALGFREVTALAVAKSLVYEVREGMQFNAVQHALIDHNQVWSVIPNYALGDHPDMIQFFTQTYGASDDVTISNNSLLLGKGMDTHGIFISSQEGSYYSNFLIENNLVSTNNYHGITVDHMNGAVIRDNTVLTTGSVGTATIALTNSDSIQYSNNIATDYTFQTSTNVTRTGDIELHTGGTRNATSVENNFVNALRPYTAAVADFAETAGSLAALGGGFSIAEFQAQEIGGYYDALVTSLDAGAFLHQIA